jgi:hypothetical protein
MAPARILPCQPRHQDPHVGRHGRASSPARRLPPLSPHERPMPTQQCARGDQKPAARGAWQMARRLREQGTVRGAKLRPRALATEDLELVAQDEQLDVLDVQATATANECPEQSPERHVQKREGHRADPPNPAREERDTSIGTLQALGLSGYAPQSSAESQMPLVRVRIAPLEEVPPTPFTTPGQSEGWPSERHSMGRWRGAVARACRGRDAWCIRDRSGLASGTEVWRA